MASLQSLYRHVPKLVAEGWTDAEIFESAERTGAFHSRFRPEFEAAIAAARGTTPSRVPTSRDVDRLRTDPRWIEIERGYLDAEKQRGKRPSQSEVAEAMGFDSEEPVRTRLRALGITDYRRVHALIAARRTSEAPRPSA